MKARINGIEMAYEVRGSGTPVLWVHGYPLDRTIWEPQAAALSDCAQHILPDLRGFGESDASLGAYTMELLADDLAGLLDHLNIGRTVLAGLSMGGYVVLAFARKYADRLRGLILADTRAGADTPEAAKARREGADRAMKEGVGPVVEPMVAKLTAASTQADQPELVSRLRTLLLSSRPQGVAGALMGMAERSDSTSALSRIKVPTLIIVGAEDVITPPAEARKMADAIAGSTLVEIPKAGHLPNMEQPSDFNRAVRGFLERLEGSTRTQGG